MCYYYLLSVCVIIFSFNWAVPWSSAFKMLLFHQFSFVSLPAVFWNNSWFNCYSFIILNVSFYLTLHLLLSPGLLKSETCMRQLLMSSWLRRLPGCIAVPLPVGEGFPQSRLIGRVTQAHLVPSLRISPVSSVKCKQNYLTNYFQN